MSFFGKNTSAALLDALCSPDENARISAKKQITRHKFTIKDLPLIYKAFDKAYPDDTDTIGSTKSELLFILWDLHDHNTHTFLRRIYPVLPENIDIRFRALRALVEICTVESLDIFLDILISNRPHLGFHSSSLFVPLYETTEHAGIIFPRLFELLEEKDYKYSIYHLALIYRSEGAIDEFMFKSLKGQLLRDLEAETLNKSLYVPKSEEYDDAIEMIALTLDLMGYIHDDSIIIALKDYVHDPIPKVSLCAALSLIMLDQKVPEDVFKCLAANPQTRLYLYEALEAMEREHFFPGEFLTQFHFAEAVMVMWLSHPLEFNKPPDEIELLESRDIMIDDKYGRVYLFKYIYHDDNDGWMVGASGPFSDLNKPFEIDEASKTFSHFHKLDDMSIEEHFKSFLK